MSRNREIGYCAGGPPTREEPILECELPPEAPFDGSRFEALIPPVVPPPVFTIRRQASAVFTLQEYERRGIMSPRQRTAIEAAVAERHNIPGVGGTGTGKTTFTNAVIHHMVQAAAQHRIVIIEDTSELQCAAFSQSPTKRIVPSSTAIRHSAI